MGDLIDRVIPKRRIIPGGWISQLHAMWCESWIPSRRLSRRKAEDSETRLRLDQEQVKILDMAGGNDRVIVQGSPGTGKTILAMELAQREAAQGRRVLFLCFTEALGRELARNPDKLSGFWIRRQMTAETPTKIPTKWRDTARRPLRGGKSRQASRRNGGIRVCSAAECES